MWDLWWKKWQWDRFLSKLFGFPLSISLPQDSILIYHPEKTQQDQRRLQFRNTVSTHYDMI
jgi:hypothetical protein